MCKDAGLFRQVVASQCLNFYPYDPGSIIQLPTIYGPICRKGTAANLLLSLQSSDAGCTYDFELLFRCKLLSAPGVAIVDTPEAASWNYVYIVISFWVPFASGGVYWWQTRNFSMFSAYSNPLCVDQGKRSIAMLMSLWIPYSIFLLSNRYCYVSFK